MLWTRTCKPSQNYHLSDEMWLHLVSSIDTTSTSVNAALRLVRVFPSPKPSPKLLPEPIQWRDIMSALNALARAYFNVPTGTAVLRAGQAVLRANQAVLRNIGQSLESIKIKRTMENIYIYKSHSRLVSASHASYCSQRGSSSRVNHFLYISLNSKHCMIAPYMYERICVLQGPGLDSSGRGIAEDWHPQKFLVNVHVYSISILPITTAYVKNGDKKSMPESANFSFRSMTPIRSWRHKHPCPSRGTRVFVSSRPNWCHTSEWKMVFYRIKLKPWGTFEKHWFFVEIRASGKNP